MATNLQTTAVIKGKDETKAALASAKKGFLSLSDGAKQTAKNLGIIGGIVGGVLVAGLVSSAKAAMEAQVQMAKVDATLKAMGPSAIANRDALLQAASAAVKLGFDDEAAAVSLSKLYQRTNDLTEATKLNNLAMDLARAKNIDLETSGKLVGMVMSGNGKALKEFGIILDDSLTPLEALGELQEKVAGQAQAFADTFQGKMLVLSESFENLKETIGGAILEAIQPFIDKLTVWASDPAVQKKVKEIATIIGTNLVLAFDTAIISMETFYGWWKKIVDILSDIIFKYNQMTTAIERAGEAFRKFMTAKGMTGGIARNALGVLTNGLSRLIPGFASGGVVGGPIGAPQLAMVHGGETILPTHKSGGGTTINIINPLLLDQTMIQKLSQEIGRTLRQDFRV